MLVWGRRHASRPTSAEPEVTEVSTNQGPVSIALLRGFQIIQGDRPVSLPLGAQRLVAFLALQDRPVLRVFVAGSLWLDKAEKLACASLRSALWQLRRNGLDVVAVSRNHLQLSACLEVDVWNTVAEAQQVIEGRDGQDVQPDCLLAGDLLPDWYEDWVVLERERIRQLRLHALETLGQRLIDQGRPAQAIEVGLAAVAADPLRESAHRVVISAHLAEGNHSEALRQYETYTRLLEDNLGLRPSNQIRQLIGLVWDRGLSGSPAELEPSTRLVEPIRNVTGRVTAG
jgi:DNA-binding SARP family transcriptional activator